MSGPRSESATRARAHSTSRSRPATPLRPSSRSSLRESVANPGSFPLNALEPAFADFSDALADLEANMMHFQLMHESLTRFGENFAGFMYGLNMNAFCVDFPEGPIPESFKRAKKHQNENESPTRQFEGDGTPGNVDSEMTFMTTDTSFVEDPEPGPASSKSSSKFQNPKPTARHSRVPPPSRGGTATRASRGSTRGLRPSGLARPRGRGVR